MSWKNALSILAVGALLGLPFGTLADNDRNDRGKDRDRHDRDRAEREAQANKKKAERDARFEAQLITRYTTLTGSAANATSLVKGLHNDTTVTLTRVTTIVVTVPGTDACPHPRFPQPPGCGQPPRQETQTIPETESFDPPTPKMTYKGVAIALAFMEAKLKNATPPVTAPSPKEIKDVLVGTPNGILTLRAKKLNWHKIAQLQGFDVHHGKPKPAKGKGKDDDDDDDDD